jgi:D-tyrosyl-tRNA(Tyr) deacylase
MLKQASENPGKKLFLTSKLTNMIIKKSYLKQYFSKLQENLKLNIELNNGGNKDGLNVEDEELLHDLNDSDNEDLFANSEQNAFSALSANNNEYDIKASNNFSENLKESLTNHKDSDDDNDDGFDMESDGDLLDGKFLN